MSIDLVLSCFNAGRLEPLPTQALLAPFASAIVRVEPRCVVLRFGADQESVVFIDTQAEHSTGLTLHRPVRAAALYEALHRLLRIDGMVMLVPDDVPPLVGSAATSARLPPGMLEALGQPVLPAAPADLMGWIEHGALAPGDQPAR